MWVCLLQTIGRRRPTTTARAFTTVSYDNSKIIFEGIKTAGIRSISALPETWLGLLLQRAEDDPEVSLVQVAKEEEAIGIPAGAWVLLRTDWSKRTDPADFLNVAEDGPHSPGFRKDASEYLVGRDILGVGVETIGTDAGQAGTFDPPFPNHATMHGGGKFGLASLCNLDRLPPTGAMVIAAPLKVVEGNGSPVRVLALVEG